MVLNWKKSVIFFIIGFLIASFIIFMAGWAYFYFGFLEKVDIGGRIISIEIKEGQTLSDLTRSLKEQGVIKSELLFKIAARNNNFEKGLQVGFYEFSGMLNGYDVLKILQNQPHIAATIPEGKTVEQIGEILENNKIIVSKEDFFKTLNDFDAAAILGFTPLNNNFEGYLFPDTYYFKPGQKPEMVIKTILQNFKNKIITGLRDKILNAKYEIRDTIIMASIIEKEVIGESDKKIAAGILWKRLKDSYPMQVDSTLNYVLKTNRAWLNAKELETDSPYNSYKYKGLPPTPISNPGLESIIAALEPVQTDFYFYLTDKSGKAHFAKTYDEHLRNIKKYLR